MAVIAVLLALAVAACLSAWFASPVGETVVVATPSAAATYRDNGRDALDDEALYGMAGVIEDGPDGDGRYRVRMRYGYRLALAAADIWRGGAGADAWEAKASHRVVAPFADVVPAPDLKAHPPLMTLPRGALVPVTGEEGEYCRVSLHTGVKGYIRRPSLRALRNWSDAGEATNRRRVVEDALSYLGSAYRWGGKTPAGIDCSGLASMAYLLNGLAIYRNSRPQPGFPIALLHLEPGEDGKHTPGSLARAKPGDLLYWQGHQAVYLGDGRYAHANATSYDVRVNSLLERDADYRPDLADPKAIHAWGTAYPDEPGRLVVRRFDAKPDDGGRRFRFYAKADGFAPTRALLYPEGPGEGKPEVRVDNPRYMLYDDPDSRHEAVPRHTYQSAGQYQPTLILINDAGWRPDAEEIRTDAYAMPGGLRVE